MTLSERIPAMVARRIAVAATMMAAAFTNLDAQSPVGARPKGTVRTDTVWSQSLGIKKELRIYLPPSYRANSTKRYPVLFYLHGLGGSEKNWTESGKIDVAMDSLIEIGKAEAIIVMPDGDDGWWTTANMFADLPGCRADTTRKESADTYCTPWLHYDDYVARDLVTYVDRQYRTIASRNSRGIGGLSMGGYGAVTIALAYPDVFAAAASHSGVLSPRFIGPRPYAPPSTYGQDSIGLKTAVGGLWKTMRVAFGVDTMGWLVRDPARMALRAKTLRKGPMPALLIDCGVSDGHIHENRDFHATLTTLGVSHEYAEWPGVHDWNYWRTHVPESISFLLGKIQTSAAAR